MNGRPRLLLVQNSEHSGPGRLTAWFDEAGIDTVVVAGPDLPDHLPPPTPSHPSAQPLRSAGRPPVGRSDTPTSPTSRASAVDRGVDGLVLLGGGSMPDDDERFPYLRRERALVAEALEHGAPVLGICLGAQVLAHVAGGTVTASSGETERGSCPVTLLAPAADDPLFARLSSYGELRMIQNHRDSITTLPAAAVLLATSDACRVQAFRVGPCAWGVQFHPETDAVRLTQWNESALAAVGIDLTELVAQAIADSAVNTDQARTLVGAFATVVHEAGH